MAKKIGPLPNLCFIMSRKKPISITLSNGKKYRIVLKSRAKRYFDNESIDAYIMRRVGIFPFRFFVQPSWSKYDTISSVVYKSENFELKLQQQMTRTAEDLLQKHLKEKARLKSYNDLLKKY